MGKRVYIDIPKRLGWIRNCCERKYNTPATVEQTRRHIPYVRVGKDGHVRVVIFARTRSVRVFFDPHWNGGVQLHTDFPFGERGLTDKIISDVAEFATSTAKAIEGGE